jgi:hypothetical protein
MYYSGLDTTKLQQRLRIFSEAAKNMIESKTTRIDAAIYPVRFSMEG